MDASKVDEVKRTMVESMAKGDSVLYSSIYGTEGQILMEGGLVIEGPQNIQHQIESFMGLLGPLHFSLVRKDFWDQGETAFESGRFEYYYDAKLEEPFYTGTYVFIWKENADSTVSLFRNVSIDD